jgi:hypothetical protein
MGPFNAIDESILSVKEVLSNTKKKTLLCFVCRVKCQGGAFLKNNGPDRGSSQA